MEKFTRLSAVAAPLPMVNVDTDMIIPKQFLKTIKRTGLAKGLFYDLRFDEAGKPKPDFVLDQPAYKNAKILIAGRNFGCGSSREHAPWALLDAGIRAVISSEIADIFRGNALKNGLLPIVLSPDAVASLLSLPGIELRIDIARGEVRLPDGETHRFELDPFARTCLLEGVDQLGYLLNQSAAIQRYEEQRHAC